MKKSGSYIFSADVIRTLAIFGVVAIHTANSVYERPDFFGGISWWLAIIIDSVSRICIPLFIMISGFLLLKKNEKFSITFKRIVNRLLIPLVFWTALIYVTSNLKTAYTVFSLDFLLRFFSGNVYYFYFLTILIGLYFISPLLSSYLRHENLERIKKMVVFFILAGLAETATEYLVKNCAIENSFTKWVPYTGIFLFGYLIGTAKWKIKSSKLIKWGYLLGFAATVILNYIYYSYGSIKVLRTLPSGCLSQYSDYYLSLNVVLMSLTAFVFLVNFDYKSIKNTIWEKIIYAVARASFGIYLVNLFVVNFWDKWLHLDVDSIRVPLWTYVIVKLVSVFVLSFLLTILLKKIPIIKKVMGEDK